MLSVIPPPSRFMTALFTLVIATPFALHVSAQESPAVRVGNTEIRGLPDDWSHHHVVYTNPGTEEDAIKNGTYDQWVKIVNEPRYVMHQLKHHSSVSWARRR